MPPSDGIIKKNHRREFLCQGSTATYVAAMLVLDENEELSDKLYSRYCDLMSDLCATCPASAQPIVDVYGFN